MMCSWPATPLEDDDLLQEILLRLPPQQCSRPRASAVCMRWLGLVTDPKFIARFRDHHGKPPLLGVFHRSRQGITFTPLLDPPDRIPTLRFDLGRYKDYDVLSCRHGRLLAVNHPQDTILLVCDPITGKQCRMAVPAVFREFDNIYSDFTGSVLCADRTQCHLHGGCHSGSFKVVLVKRKDDRPIFRVYSSKTRTWGEIISTAAPCDRLHDCGALVGNALYWCGFAKDIVVLDLDEHSLAVITGPPITSEFRYGDSQIIQAEDGGVGLVILSYPRFRMWRRNVDCHGVATWEIWKTIDMHNNIPGIPRTEGDCIMVGYCEDTDAFFYTCGTLCIHGSPYVDAIQENPFNKIYQLVPSFLRFLYAR